MFVPQITVDVYSVIIKLNPSRYLKLHFDTPGASQSESLSQLAHGMTTAKAARLFYQACGMSSIIPMRVNR